MSDDIDTQTPAPTTAQSGTIQAIGKDTVHKICSGQVVLSLAVAVKELVENAIDAGATLVEVKLRDQGLESVDVSDNGSGVEEHNLEGMTAKYHTSKIREFVDLQCVETFGFRGEALSSLCALSDMVIQTRHKSSDIGIKIELDHEGKIKHRTPCARGIGTTVTLSNLFITLPVRRRDFMRNIKKEFTKMCQILQAYCLVSKGVRIICSNQTPKGTKSVILQTHGAQDVLANISAIFGCRQVTDIVPLKSPFADGKLSEEGLRTALQADAGDTTMISSEDVARLNEAEFQLEGFVSSCRHGAGRSSKDRQFYFVNSRPCDPKHIAKIVNEVYHRYNVQQYPFVYLNLLTTRADVDVNLTPDKRQLLLNNEKIILLALKQALLNTYGNTPSTFKLQNSTIVSMFEAKTSATNTKESPNKVKVEPEESSDVPLSSSQRFMDVLSQWKHTGNTQGIAPQAGTKRKFDSEAAELASRTMKLQKIQEFLTKELPPDKQKVLSYKSESSDTDDDTKLTKAQEVKPNTSILDVRYLKKESSEYDELMENDTATDVKGIDCKIFTPSKSRLDFVVAKPSDNGENDYQLMLSQNSTVSVTSSADALSDEDYFIANNLEAELITKTVELDESDNLDEIEANYACGELRTSLEEIAQNLKAEEQFRKEKCMRAKLERLRFKSEIKPNQNQNAEAELQKEIAKEDFVRMEIIGQFNLGFIIVKLDDDLFIVDQHATDEKYNFETLQHTTTLQYQKLAVPQALELTAVNELILLDHLSIFEKNGFKFEINEQAPATKKIRLLGKPFSNNWGFGKEDIDELIFMLQDAPEGTLCRPSRIRAMFASRACRKSVMIGTALNKAAMKTIVTHMGEIEQPWNCPHGRPTMRHLINITMLMDAEDGNDNA